VGQTKKEEAMSKDQEERIFISYSRKDGTEFASRLREQLREANLSVWQDIFNLEADPGWWRQIEDQIKSPSTEYLILVMT
jgi:hypothetical protein